MSNNLDKDIHQISDSLRYFQEIVEKLPITEIDDKEFDYISSTKLYKLSRLGLFTTFNETLPLFIELLTSKKEDINIHLLEELNEFENEGEPVIKENEQTHWKELYEALSARYKRIAEELQLINKKFLDASAIAHKQTEDYLLLKQQYITEKDSSIVSPEVINKIDAPNNDNIVAPAPKRCWTEYVDQVKTIMIERKLDKHTLKGLVNISYPTLNRFLKKDKNLSELIVAKVFKYFEINHE